MKEPEFTCPNVDTMKELLDEIKDTSVLEAELGDLTSKIIKAVNNQYEFYTNDVSKQLELVRANNIELRGWGKNLQKKNKIIEDLFHDICNYGKKFDHSDWSNYSVQEIESLELKGIKDLINKKGDKIENTNTSF